MRVVAADEAICPVCEKPAVDGATHPRCQTRYALDGLTNFFHYTGAVRQAVKAIKYRYVSDLANDFVNLVPKDLFHQLARQQRNNKAVLVPIPLHPGRLRWRGFNQAELLGGVIAGRLNIPERTDVLRRIKKTIPQVEMKDRQERLKNMGGVFRKANSQFPIRRLTILLFDDVFTTGATLRCAANVLKRAGAARVWGITMAR